MKKNRIAIFSVLVAALAATMSVTSCKTSQKSGSSQKGDLAEEVDEKVSPSVLKERVGKIVASYKDWTTFKAQGKVTIGGSKTYTSAMQLMMVKDKCISVSIKPMLGIEVGKIYITNDSIIVLNKLEKYYIAENLKVITGGIPFNINDMQNVFLSRMFELGNGTLKTDAKTLNSITQGDGGVMNVKLTPADLGLNYTFSVKKNGEIKNLTAALNGSISDFFVNYYDYGTSSYGRIADTIEVTSRFDNKDISLKFEYEPMYVEWDKKVKYGNPIDSRYRKVEARALLSGWLK